MGEYFAHIDGCKEKYQFLRDHCRNTAKIAGSTLKDVHLYHTAYLAGLLHDLGKYTRRFQQYLTGETKYRRGTVIHTFQGCKYIMESYHNESDSDIAWFTAELIAIAVGSHHGQFDCIDHAHISGLSYRSKKEDMDYDEAVSAFFKDCASKEEIDRLFRLSEKEISMWSEALNEREIGDDTEFDFSLGLLVRLVTSAVIEGDRTDTALFMNGIKIPVFPEDRQRLWHERLSFMEAELEKLPGDTPIGSARRQISEQCRQSAEKPGGIYRLYVPTGGGKTLSALRYALAHAKIHKKQRLIFTSPLLSILEQNALQIRKFLGKDELILEHHSNVVQTDQTQDELDERELFTQSWESPVIITTLVQLLNTLFDGKTTAIRRFHALCNSVIVIDEVQTVPTKLLSLFNRAIFFLSAYCGATIVFSSATQPCLEEAEHPVRTDGGDIVPFDHALWEVFARTRIEVLPPMHKEDVVSHVQQQMEQTSSFLVVCNKKNEAAELAEQLNSDAWKLFHLSAGMCMQHRRDVLARMTEILRPNSKTEREKAKQKVLCVSTQVIEAGVDISFGMAERFVAGMDSVIQTAGRCNRNGESEDLCPVYLVNCLHENLGKLPEIQRGKDATIELLAAYEADKDRFGCDLSSDKAIRFYYHCLYRNMNKEAQDFVLYSSDRKPDGSLYDYLSSNKKYSAGAGEEAQKYILRQAFKTAGKAFSVFDDDTTDVLVPYGEGIKLISELSSERARKDALYRAMLLKQASGFTVSLYAWQRKQLENKGALYSICDGSVLVLQNAFYDDTIGLQTRSDTLAFLEV